MNCQDAEESMIAARDGALTTDKRAVLAAHLTGCVSCSRLRDAFSENSKMFRASAQSAALPDVADEWLEIRSRIRKPAPTAVRSFRLIPFLGVPLAAAAALVIAFVSMPQWFGTSSQSSSFQEARAEFVEVPGSDTTTLVFVDEPSGWLVVWAVAPTDQIGG